MQVEAGVMHLEYKGIEVESQVTWDLVQGGPIYALRDGKIFLSLSAEDLKALYVIYRDIEIKGTIEDA
tara:strand:- start:747 stop:950 length:204 start_codon:yes stop_codon:yes gene_type:complete